MESTIKNSNGGGDQNGYVLSRPEFPNLVSAAYRTFEYELIISAVLTSVIMITVAAYSFISKSGPLKLNAETAPNPKNALSIFLERIAKTDLTKKNAFEIRLALRQFLKESGNDPSFSAYTSEELKLYLPRSAKALAELDTSLRNLAFAKSLTEHELAETKDLIQRAKEVVNRSR